MRRKQRRIETGLLATALQDQVDGLRRERPTVDVAPLIDAPKYRSFLDRSFCQPMFQGAHWPADQQHMLAIIACGRLGATEMKTETGEGRGILVGWIGAHRFLVNEIPDVQSRHFGTATAAGGGQEQGPIAHVNQSIGGACFEELCEHVASNCLPALALARPGAGANGKP